MNPIAMIIFFICVPLLVILWGGSVLWALQRGRDVTDNDCHHCGKPRCQGGENGFCADCSAIFKKRGIFWERPNATGAARKS